MPLKNNRNSRDDKSQKSSRSVSRNSSKPKLFEKDPGRGFKTGESKTGERAERSSEDRPYKKPSSRPGTSFNRDDRSKRPSEAPYKGKFADKRNSSSEDGSSRFSKPAGERTERKFSSDKPFSEGRGKRAESSGRPSGDRPRNYSDKPKSFGGRSERRSPSDKPFNENRGKRAGSSERPSGERSRNYTDKPKSSFGGTERNSGGTKKPFSDRKPSFNSDERPAKRFDEKEGGRSFSHDGRRSFDENKKWSSEEKLQPANRARKAKDKNEEEIRLNRYISNSGICSRRKADDLILAGVISVNGEVITELGHKVNPSKDEIRYNGETLKREKMVYVLLNKPKDYITTTEDPQERRTVMHLVEKATRERIYPVGRLDRNTTGLLLMTNDGDLADKLSHPKNSITKLYHVELNKSLVQGDLNKIAFGIELEDGLIKPDQISYIQGGSKREVGIQIHSGKNRIVRRIFEHLGYDVVKLDRAVYANLTKKDLPRGRWRYLEEKEIIQLKHLI